MSNSDILEHLFATQQIKLVYGPLFTMAPPPLPASFDFARIEGMLLGLAIGDALGNTTEGQRPDKRRAGHGEIRDYLPNYYADGRAVGLPSDDSQMAFWTLEQLLSDDGLNPEHVANRFCEGRIFGMGGTVQEFIRAHQDEKLPWYRCGQPSAGNGALMRIAPVLLPHLRSPSPDLWADAALLAMITHNDATSTSACLAFVHMLWELLRMDSPPPRRWWLDTYVTTAQELEGETRLKPRGGVFENRYEGPLWRFVAEKLPAADEEGLSTLAACNQWYSAAYLLETVPSALYIVMRYGHDPEEAIVRAVNDTKDNDTVAAIVGAAVGALHGKDGLPQRWLDGLLGRTTADDDGKVFALLAQARERWAPA